MADRNILIFGAGKIGRSFIGQLFGKHGYKVVFVDKERRLVDELNRQKQYQVVIKGPDFEENITIQGVSAVHTEDTTAVIEAICRADLMAISVGKTALPAVAKILSEGLMMREKTRPGAILDIILAENMRSADLLLREKLSRWLPSSYPLDQQVGLVSTSIGKMVPLMTSGDLEEDPLRIFAEPYNTLILNGKGFRGSIPELPELAPKENIQAWVDRKAFIHNLGHATAAYTGHLKYPDAIFMFEVLDDWEVHRFTREVMQESAGILMAVYPGEFSPESLSAHIDDLLSRFRNRNLGDTVFRVGNDLKRKLGADDRFMAVIRTAVKTGLGYEKILQAMSRGFSFRATDEQGRRFPGDIEFHKEFEKDPDKVLQNICGLKFGIDDPTICRLKHHLSLLP